MPEVPAGMLVPAEVSGQYPGYTGPGKVRRRMCRAIWARGRIGSIYYYLNILLDNCYGSINLGMLHHDIAHATYNLLDFYATTLTSSHHRLHGTLTYGCCDDTQGATMKAAKTFIRCISRHRKSCFSNSVTVLST
jgi:hypothetical protein